MFYRLLISINDYCSKGVGNHFTFALLICETFLCLFLLTDVREQLEQFSSEIKQTADAIKVKLKGT